jgi:hypothetical protein
MDSMETKKDAGYLEYGWWRPLDWTQEIASSFVCLLIRFSRGRNRKQDKNLNEMP